MKKRNALWSCLALITYTFSPAAGAAVIDQNLFLPSPGQDFGAYGGYEIRGGYRIGQTFETGISGYLDRVEVQFAFNFLVDTQPLDLNFSIYTIAPDGLPVGDAVASTTITRPEDIDPDFIGISILSMDFSDQGMFMNAGESYALVAESFDLSASWGTWIYEVFDGTQFIRGDHYEGGSGIYDGPYTDNQWASFDDDPFLAFDSGMATYISPVPLPASGVLLMFGLGALGVSRTFSRG